MYFSNKGANTLSILISVVGNTDPISNHYDGATLHLARVLQPNKIVLLYSEEFEHRHEEMLKCLKSIEGYTPEVLKYPKVISNEDIYRFDKMYDLIDTVLFKFTDARKNRSTSTDSEIILNLSSGTPQVKGAFYAINRISNYHLSAYQVISPMNASNPHKGLTSSLNIEEEIRCNIDHQPNFKSRVLKDNGENLNRALAKRHITNLINQYDYAAALSVLNESGNLTNGTIIAQQLDQLVAAVNLATIPKDFDSVLNIELVEKVRLTTFACAVLKMKLEKNDVAETLVRCKSIMEYLCKELINRNHPTLLKEVPGLPITINRKFSDKELVSSYQHHASNRSKSLAVNLNGYLTLTEYYHHEKEHELIEKVHAINCIRNNVAHELQEVKKYNEAKLNEAVEAVLAMNQVLFPQITHHMYDVFKTQYNKKLIALLE